MDLGDDATGYSECGEGSVSTCPQSGHAVLTAVRKMIAYLKANLGAVNGREMT